MLVFVFLWTSFGYVMFMYSIHLCSSYHVIKHCVGQYNYVCQLPSIVCICSVTICSICNNRESLLGNNRKT